MNTLSFLVVFALMAAYAFGIPSPNESAIRMAASKCREGTTITQEMVETLIKENTHHEDPDEQMKCYFKCFFQEMGMFGMDGSIILDAQHNHFMDCSKKVADVMNHCDKAYKFDICVHQQFPELPIA